MSSIRMDPLTRQEAARRVAWPAFVAVMLLIFATTACRLPALTVEKSTSEQVDDLEMT